MAVEERVTIVDHDRAYLIWAHYTIALSAHPVRHAPHFRSGWATAYDPWGLAGMA
jgi:hypothetical protein